MTGRNLTLHTRRFLLRELTGRDVTERYLTWLRDPGTGQFIQSAAGTTELSDLTSYVLERIGRDDVIFLGIFDSESGTHIGNLKFEPVDPASGYAIAGILIGDPAYRGRGVACEVLNAAGLWLKQRYNVRHIALGVNRDNVAAVRAYEKAGFVAAATPYIPDPSSSTITMVWEP